MFKNILVPTDLADKSKRSITAALELAVKGGGHVELLHIVEKVGGDSDGEMEDFYLKLAEEACQKLTVWQQKFQEEFPSVKLEKTISVGRRAQEVLNFCQEKEIDLIVMTSRTFSIEGSNKDNDDKEIQGKAMEKNKTYGLGTLSHQIALFAPISVLVIR